MKKAALEAKQANEIAEIKKKYAEKRAELAKDEAKKKDELNQLIDDHQRLAAYLLGCEYSNWMNEQKNMSIHSCGFSEIANRL